MFPKISHLNNANFSKKIQCLLWVFLHSLNKDKRLKPPPLGQLVDAITADDLEAITVALSKGADVTTHIFWCGTPLEIAKRKGKSAQCIQLLEDKAARINLVRTTLYWSPQNHPEFVWYSRKNVSDTIKTVLLVDLRLRSMAQQNQDLFVTHQDSRPLVVTLPNEIWIQILRKLQVEDFLKPKEKKADPCTIL